MYPSKRRRWSPESMAAAVNEVKNGFLSLLKASKKYNVPKSTLHDHVTDRVKEGAVNGKTPVLTADEEKQLLKSATERAEMGVGFSKRNFLRAAGALARKRGVSFKNGAPSEKWWTLFKKRNGGEVSLRQPEATATIRHQMMTRQRTDKYFFALNDVLTTNRLDNKPMNIWNMDESFIALSSDSPLVVARTGTKYIHSKSGNRENITILACGNAAGVMMPPHFITKGKTQQALKSWDTENAPFGSFISVSDSGWTKQGISLLWFENVFLKNIGEERPQILIFDGHDSHHHVELIESARENQIILMEMPAHCSHWLQPLDRSVFGPLKKKWQEISSSFTTETACPVTHANFFRLFTKSWSSLKPDYLVNGFRVTGIYPFNPSAIPNEAYLPSQLYADPAGDSAKGNPEAMTSSYISFPADCDMAGECTPALPHSTPSVAASTAYSETERVFHPDESDFQLYAEIPNFSADEIEAFQNMGFAVTNVEIPALQPTMESTNGECPPDLALAAIECSLTVGRKQLYETCFEHGVNIDGDSVFHTWKKLKSKQMKSAQPTVDFLGNIPHVPKLAAKEKSKPSTGSKDGYFVNTCDEAYQSKLKKEEEKKERERKKKLNAEKRKAKNQLKK